MTTQTRYLRYDDGFWPHTLAVMYAFGGYAAGFALILFASWPGKMAGTLWLAHAMVIAGYMIHECAHNTVFLSAQHNARLGRALNWLTGGCYGTYEDLRHKHMRHHVDNADVIALDYRGWLLRHPRMLTLTRALEWAYVPVVDIMMHAMLVIAPFVFESKKTQRWRVVRVAAIRWTLGALLFWYSWQAWLLYLLAYGLFLMVLRFMDAFQHSFEYVLALDDNPELIRHKGDREYEDTHTYSNPIAANLPAVDWLTLNFGYHNAHHTRPTAPWYRLRALHFDTYGNDRRMIVPLKAQLLSFHRRRMDRVLLDAAEEDPAEVARRWRDGTVVGSTGASFLTAF